VKEHEAVKERRSVSVSEPSIRFRFPLRSRAIGPFLLLFPLLFGLLALRPWSPASVRREAGLNVLLVTVDTLRWDALGAYGQKRPTSPLLDRLARAGVRFETAHAHNTVTLPSHANLLSGRYPFDHGVRDNAGFRFPRETETLATLLKGRGYATGAFVSAFALDSRFGLDRGFDVYEDSFGDAAEAGRFRLPERPGRETVRLAREWVARQEGPWLAWVHLYEPHAPYRPSAAFAAAFRGQPYLGEVREADEALRPLLEPLLEAGRAGRTIVAVTSDHGESLGEHGEATHGLFAYESTLRVPLLLFAPRLVGARVVTQAVRHVDVLPTILDALEMPLPAGLPGRSLLALAAGRGDQTGPGASYFEALAGMLGRGWAPLYGVVRDGKKYVDVPLPELYDLAKDPGETTNLVARSALDRERLVATLAPLRAADPGVRRTEESKETRERLAALGYVAAAAVPVRSAYTEDDDPKRLVHLDRLMEETIARHRDGNLEGALEAAREVVRQRPGMTAALMQVALLERKRGRLDAAIAALEKAIAASPEEASVAVLLGSYLGEAGRAREAAALLEPYARREDPPLDVLTARATALARLGRTGEAVAAFERARAADPGNPATLVQLATVHLAAGRNEEARALLEEAVRRNPDVALAQHQLGLLALARGDRDEAAARLRRALALDPSSADTLLNLGRLLAATGREAEARPLLARFLATAPPEIYAREIRRVAATLGPGVSGPRGAGSR
jgi:arylsulfatase A-like enzyme/thioredoxin-like negative regulator of GroEL